jgi:hypothetical protein
MHRSDQNVAAGQENGSGRELLGIYLNDHLAGATMGAELASRIAGGHRETDESETYERFAAEVTEDRAALLEIMATLEVPVRQYKVVLGWVAEKIGRLKPNGHLLSRSPLSSLEEIEIMRLGVEGKLAAWRTLRVLADRDDRLDSTRLDGLMRRAGEQTDTLENLRVRATEELVDAG